MRAAIHFDDLQWERSYSRIGAYGQSKLANLLFTYELQRRLAARPGAASRPSRPPRIPGGSNTELARNLPGVFAPVKRSTRAAAVPEPRDGRPADAAGRHRPRPSRAAQYYGPEGFAEQRGNPKIVQSSAQSHDEELQRRLWTVSEELTGVTFPV